MPDGTAFPNGVHPGVLAILKEAQVIRSSRAACTTGHPLPLGAAVLGAPLERWLENALTHDQDRPMTGRAADSQFISQHALERES